MISAVMNSIALTGCNVTLPAAVEPQFKNFIDKVKPFDTGHASADVVAIIQSVIDNA